MLDICNFKSFEDVGIFSHKIKHYCGLSLQDTGTNGAIFHRSCDGEDNCIFFLTYKLLQNKKQ